MLSFAKFYDKINTSLVFLILNFNLVYIIFWFRNMFGESPPKVWALKDILGKALQTLHLVKSYIA